MSTTIVSDLRFYKHTGTVCRDFYMRPTEQLRGSNATAIPFPEPRIAMKPPHCAPPCGDLLGLEPSLRSLPYSLALLRRQEREGTVKALLGEGDFISVYNGFERVLSWQRSLEGGL